jgi:hypothetical protein
MTEPLAKVEKPEDLLFSTLDSLQEVLVIVIMYLGIMYMQKEAPPTLPMFFKFLGLLVVLLFAQFYILKLDMFKIFPSTVAAVLATKVFKIML